MKKFTLAVLAFLLTTSALAASGIGPVATSIPTYAYRMGGDDSDGIFRALSVDSSGRVNSIIKLTDTPVPWRPSATTTATLTPNATNLVASCTPTLTPEPAKMEVVKAPTPYTSITIPVGVNSMPAVSQGTPGSQTAPWIQEFVYPNPSATQTKIPVLVPVGPSVKASQTPYMGALAPGMPIAVWDSQNNKWQPWQSITSAGGSYIPPVAMYDVNGNAFTVPGANAASVTSLAAANTSFWYNRAMLSLSNGTTVYSVLPAPNVTPIAVPVGILFVPTPDGTTVINVEPRTFATPDQTKVMPVTIVGSTSLTASLTGGAYINMTPTPTGTLTPEPTHTPVNVGGQNFGEDAGTFTFTGWGNGGIVNSNTVTFNYVPSLTTIIFEPIPAGLGGPITYTINASLDGINFGNVLTMTTAPVTASSLGAKYWQCQAVNVTPTPGTTPTPQTGKIQSKR